MTSMKPEAKAILDAARAEIGPTDEDRARVRSAVAALATGAAAATAAGAPVAAAAASASGVVATTAAVPAVGAVGSVAATVAGATVTLGAVVKIGLVVVSLGAVGGGVAVWSASTTTTPPTAVAPPALPVAVEPSPAPTARVVADAVERDADEEVSDLVAPTSERAPSRARVVDDALPPSEATTPDELMLEAKMIREAHQALQRGDAASALAGLDAHAERFPRGLLVEERDAARVLALCAAGRADEARTRGARFVEVYPTSPLVGRVRSACAR